MGRVPTATRLYNHILPRMSLTHVAESGSPTPMKSSSIQLAQQVLGGRKLSGVAGSFCLGKNHAGEKTIRDFERCLVTGTQGFKPRLKGSLSRPAGWRFFLGRDFRCRG